jgi:hypothetical protein
MHPVRQAVISFVRQWGAAITLASLALSAIGVALGTWVIVQMPADHFLRSAERPADRHPILHAIWLGIRTAMGLVLLVLGILMLFIPGQGWLTIVLGLSLMDFPGRTVLLHRVLAMPSIRRTLNWLRRRFARPELQFPGQTEGRAF